MNSQQVNENMVFRLSSRRSPKEVKLLHLEWAVVTQLDGEKSVGNIANILALSQVEARDIFSRLVAEGLLELVTTSPADAHLPPEVFDDIEHELTLLMGPVACILIDDVLQEIGKVREKVEKPVLPLILDFLTNHIPDAAKQLEFQKNILTKTKKHLI